MKRYSLFLISLILLMTTGCNQRKEVAENPFFEEWETPYGVPPFDRIRPEHFLPAFQRAMSIQEAEIDAIKSNGDQPSFENVILAYDRSGLMLEQVGLVFNMLCSADVNDQLLAAKEQAMPLLAAHRDNILLDEVLFDKIKAVYAAAWVSMPCRRAWWRRFTVNSCGPERCSIRSRRSGCAKLTANWRCCP